MKCHEIMTSDPVVCTREQDCAAVAQLFCEHDFGSVPVVENDSNRRIVGMITDRDICCRIAARDKQPSGVKAGEIMSQSVYTCRREDDVSEAIRLMKEHQIRRIPVLDDDDQVVGMVAQADIAREATTPETADVIRSVSQPTLH